MSTSPAITDLDITQGETYVLFLKWLTEGVPVDLMGFTAELQFRSPNRKDVILVASTANGKLCLGGAEGWVLMLLTETETAIFDFRKPLRYDLELKVEGIVKRLVQGKVNLDLETTL